MRRQGLALLCTLGLAALAAALAATVARAHSTPQIKAEQEHARTVLAEVGRIGKDLQQAEDRAWNAQQKLAQVNRDLRQNADRLHVAKGNLHGAQKRIMSRIYSLYVNGAPSTVDVLAGSHSISQLIDRSESAQVLSDQDSALAQQAIRFEHAVQRRELQLKALQSKREKTLSFYNAQKQAKASELDQQKRLLASIHTTIANLQAQEAAREKRERAAALERLREQEAAARQRAAQQTASTPTATPTSAPTSSPTPGPPPPVTGTGAGHPEAATIALGYLGVPYVYGGASPSGFDCSGLVMYVYAKLGISLPHYTVAQWNATEPISQSQMQPGDLVFFDGLGHVGIYIGNGQFVDAPHTGSVVRIDSIAGFGSFDGARRVP
ncbi:MAG TPA: NlpC/P60 family protein [Gaiellaceae bacterium]